ncbi:MAG: hypothetical protein D8M59_12115 [Planctomycetes bacterium]|nr:hypothetical protein [Planctomycetota bacterium]NOG53551.1 monovalent cation/H(+) antiporter subunit G [Planctomycetota bacterium]
MIERVLADSLACICLLAGMFFLFVGAVGIVRFPDAYNRLHASSKCSTLGLLGLVLAAIFHVGTLAVATKGLLTVLFAFVATPVGSHILAKAAHMDLLKQWPGTLSDELAEDYPDRCAGQEGRVSCSTAAHEADGDVFEVPSGGDGSEGGGGSGRQPENGKSVGAPSASADDQEGEDPDRSREAAGVAG